MKYLQCRVDLMQTMLEGLNGKPFKWEYWTYNSHKPLMREIGVTLITKTEIKRRGLTLRQRNNTPVGEVHFKRFDKWAEVYILECQCIER